MVICFKIKGVLTIKIREMKNLFTTTILLLIIIGCNNKSVVNNQNNPPINSSNSVEKPIKIDTKVFADSVLKGLKRPSDDDATFACMDSLTSNNSRTRDFYWQVFQVILDKSDGALSEVVGADLIDYFVKYPREFAMKYAKLGKNRRDKCIFFVASEYYLSIETEGEINEIFKKIKLSCRDCKSTEIGVLEKFEKDVLIEVKNLKAND
jgi:hypothetical protein